MPPFESRAQVVADLDMESVIESLQVQVVAPTHGLPVTDLPATFPKIREGLLAAEGTYDMTVQDGTKAVVDEYTPRERMQQQPS